MNKIGISFLSGVIFSTSFVMAAFDNVDCIKDQSVLGISTVECQALEKLWESTAGENWHEHQNWDTLTKADFWDGVVVKEGKVSSLRLYSNNLNGQIPSELSALSSLNKLSFSNNKLEGTVPESLGELSELDYLDLSNNRLDGTVPLSLGGLSSLTELYLNNNQFTGNIPNSLGNLESLNVLKMYGNDLTGSIPSTFGALVNLDALSLAENSLTGAIPSELESLQNLTYLDLKSNDLSGAIPVQLGNLESLRSLYLQNNSLTGEIPSTLGNLSNLTDLDLGNNQLEGKIPAALGNLSVLTYLNLADNNLSGDIPSELLELTIMNYLNLSGNRFVYTNVEAIQSELAYIPTYIGFAQESAYGEIDGVEESITTSSSEEKTNVFIEELKPISINILNETETAMHELATLKIVGTEEAGDSLFVDDEGTWSIKDNKIVFTPLEDFEGTPSSISYTIDNNEGVESNSIKVSVKSNKTKTLTLNILKNEKSDLEVYSIEILLTEDFLEQYPEAILSDDRKQLIVDTQGVWDVENNGTVVFSPEEGFTGEPTMIEYMVYTKSGDKLEVGKLDMQYKLEVDENDAQTNSVGLFGTNGLLIMILLSGLFGLYYLREIENKKL